MKKFELILLSHRKLLRCKFSSNFWLSMIRLTQIREKCKVPVNAYDFSNIISVNSINRGKFNVLFAVLYIICLLMNPNYVNLFISRDIPLKERINIFSDLRSPYKYFSGGKILISISAENSCCGSTFNAYLSFVPPRASSYNR